MCKRQKKLHKKCKYELYNECNFLISWHKKSQTGWHAVKSISQSISRLLFFLHLFFFLRQIWILGCGIHNQFVFFDLELLHETKFDVLGKSKYFAVLQLTYDVCIKQNFGFVIYPNSSRFLYRCILSYITYSKIDLVLHSARGKEIK